MKDLEIENTFRWKFFVYILGGSAAAVILILLLHYHFPYLISVGFTTSFFAGVASAVEDRHRASGIVFFRAHRFLSSLYRFSVSFTFWLAAWFIVKLVFPNYDP